LEFLEEISFELNIDPFDQVLDFVDSINKKYHDFFRIRYSFGIQSFDDEVLKSSNR
jgi:coproporphyrinogen III oxidase-like Fe-S oxidoreductase